MPASAKVILPYLAVSVNKFLHSFQSLPYRMEEIISASPAFVYRKYGNICKSGMRDGAWGMGHGAWDQVSPGDNFYKSDG